MYPKVFIILLNWNSWSDTLECLESLKNNDYPNYKVVIVDNDSKRKPQTHDSKIKIIYNNKNLGFSGGNNVGIKYALENGADYILLLNNDTIVSKNFLSEMIEVGESNKKFGLIGSKIYFYSDTKKIWFAGGQVHLINNKKHWLYNRGVMRGCGEIDKGQYDEPKIQETEYITGCCLLIKKEVIKKIGLIPEEYFVYYEDTDWSFKARKAGYKCIFAPTAKIWHKGSRTTIEYSSSYIYYHIRNGLIFANKYAPWYIKPAIHLDVVWRIIKQIIKFIFFPKKRIWAKSILLGIKDFYFGKRGEKIL
ncbi:MAG: glycosyltransferase family 2 protein [bacterium]